MKKLTLEEANKMMEEDHGDLDLAFTPVGELPDNLVVDGDLDLSHTAIEELPDNLVVGGDLDLTRTYIKELPDDLVVKGSLDLYDTPIEKLPNNLIVGHNLDLSNTSIKELPDNLIVDGDLILSNTLIEKLPDNLVIGDSLYLSNTLIEELPGDTMIGGSIICSTLVNGRTEYNYCRISNIPEGYNKDRGYLYADGILTHVKTVKLVGGYTYYIGTFHDHNVLYDGKYYAHCEDIKEGIKDIMYKRSKDRELEGYKDLSLDSVLSKDNMITMYRDITGACEQGTEMFVSSIKDLKDVYSIREVIKITEGQYRHNEFKEFFTK